MLISKFEEIKMLEEETFREIYTKKLDGESWEANLGFKNHLKNTKIFA
jgi:hypothetical protein